MVTVWSLGGALFLRRLVPIPKRSVVPQFLQQAGVGGGEGEVGQFGGGDPLEGGAIDGLRLVAQPAAAEETEVDALFRIVVGQVLHQFQDGHIDAQFLAQLARQAGFKRFPRLTFAAGKLP